MRGRDKGGEGDGEKHVGVDIRRGREGLFTHESSLTLTIFPSWPGIKYLLCHFDRKRLLILAIVRQPDGSR